MAFFDEDDELSKLHPHQMHVAVKTIGAIDNDNNLLSAFVSAHLSEPHSHPVILLSLWLEGQDALPDSDDEDSTEAQARDTFSEERLTAVEHDTMTYAVPMTPQQARALAFGLLRLADGLELEVERGLFEDRVITEMGVYHLEPKL